MIVVLLSRKDLLSLLLARGRERRTSLEIMALRFHFWKSAITYTRVDMYVYVCVYMDMFIFYSSILKMPPMPSHLKMSVLLLFFLDF